MKAECILQIPAKLGENALWIAQEQRLYWLDLNGPAVHVFNPDKRENHTLALSLPKRIGCLVQRSEGGFLLATGGGIYALDPASLNLDPFIDLPGDPAVVCFNDGKIDRQGRFWIGTSHRAEEKPLGALYRIDSDGSIHVTDRGFIVSNGPAFSPDGRLLYFADTFARTIYVYDLNPDTGSLANRRVFARLAPGHGYPDGLTVDAEGFIWSAHWDGWRVTRYAPDGAIDCVIELPVPKATSCCFGGKDMSTLFITTASVGLDEAALAQAPLAGSLFAVATPFRGLGEPAFAGSRTGA